MPEPGGRRVLAVGSLNADYRVRTRRLPGHGETVTGSDLVVSPGGKSANQAAAAALLGGEVRLLGRVGDDANGTFVLGRARAAGVDITHVQRLHDVATGAALIAVDERGENVIIVAPGANARLTARDVAEAAGFFDGAAVLCLCFEVGLPVVRAAAEAAHRAGATVVLNPSPYQHVSDELLQLVDVLVVNEHELVDLVGRRVVGAADEPDWDRVGDVLRGRGPQYVVVTRGSAGAVVLRLQVGRPAHVHREPAPSVEVVDTTGCGDAFLGALGHRLAAGDNPVTACQFAVRVAAFAATRPGAQDSYTTAQELTRFTSSLAEAGRRAAAAAAAGLHPPEVSAEGRTLGQANAARGGQPAVVVIGGANVDIKARSAAPAIPGTSNPGSASMAPGGVGRNVAENLARLGTRTYLVTAVGRDAVGDDLLDKTSAAGVRLDYVHRTGLATGTYTALLDSDGELLVAVADMSATADLGPEQVDQAREAIVAASLLVLDGNLPAVTLAHALDLAHASRVRAIFEPVSVPKATALAGYVTPERPWYAITPNRDELTALTGLPADTDRKLQIAADRLHERGVEHVWVRLGARGSLLSSASAGAAFIPAVPATVADVTGAGDAALAAFCNALLDGKDPVTAARHGHAAASLTIASPHTVRPDLSTQLIEAVLNPAHPIRRSAHER